MVSQILKMSYAIICISLTSLINFSTFIFGAEFDLFLFETQNNTKN